MREHTSERLRVCQAMVLGAMALGGCGPSPGANASIVGSWRREVPEMTVTFEGTDTDGTFSYWQPNGASLPPGCVETFHFTGTYTLRGADLATVVTAADVRRTDCDEPGNDFPPMPLSGSLLGPFAMLSGPVAITTTELRLTVGGMTIVFVRVAGPPLGDAGVSPSADAGPIVPCAGERPNVSGIFAEGGALAIARDGTIYFSVSAGSAAGSVGRLRRGGAPEMWLSISFGSTMPGLVLDAENRWLYVTVPSAGSVYAIDTTASAPSATVLAAPGGFPWALTLGPDGALYFSDAMSGHVRRLPLDGSAATQVTLSPISSDGGSTFPSAGLAFAPDGTLLCGSSALGTVERLTLTAGVESARATLASGIAGPAGLALDASGRIYVAERSSGRLLRLEADGSGATEVLGGIPGAGDVEFGAGPLDCDDVYVAGVPLSRYEGGSTPGAPVAWH